MSGFSVICSIYHDGQFWVAEVERCLDGVVSVARHVFWAEPGNAELLDWVGREMGQLAYVPIGEDGRWPKRPNPKRMKRLATAAQARAGFSPAIREAMGEQLREWKVEARREHAEERREAAIDTFAHRMAKLKARRRGR